jgi:hypothetical protein
VGQFSGGGSTSYFLENPEGASFLLADLFCFDVPIATPRVLNEFFGVEKFKAWEESNESNPVSLVTWREVFQRKYDFL